MSNILQQYYKGITQQLRSEVDFINTLFQHQGVKGEGNETVLRDLISRFIPKRYGVGTGIVIDRHGNHSRQCDIVVYDTLFYPSILTLSSVHLFPVDLVYATIEVKTTLTADSAKDALENIASIRSLEVLQEEYQLAESDGMGLSFRVYKPTSPLGIIFAYNSNAHHLETFRNWFVPPPGAVHSRFPSLVGCLDAGLLAFFNEGQVCLEPEAESQVKGLMMPRLRKLADGTFQPIVISGPIETVTYEGVTYPVKRLNNQFLAMDQSRVLLNFLINLTEMLALKRINPKLRFSEHYLSAEDRSLIMI